MVNKRDIKFYIKLFLITLKLSAFTFGGGFVIVTLMRREFVDKLDWITESEMIDYTAIAQSSPGAIAVNASILIGYRLAGIPGIITAVIATILSPLLILSVVTYCYTLLIGNAIIQNILKGMQAGISAVIVDAVIKMAKPLIKITNKPKRVISIFIIIISFILISVLKLNPIPVLIGCGIAGILIFRKQCDDLS